MTTFDERERAFEAKFVHDADMAFRIEARRNRLIGLWAAGLLGKSGPEATDYAAALVRCDMAEPGVEDVMRRLREDLGDQSDEATIRRMLESCLAEAKAQLSAGT
ncbi:DUF1476 domain-containing protein [Frigidibacter sp. MR17.24]|uniref:DUF1476 domain-containing protein n=1 Tax=Frigidibacter sp. MR17.24 TaxID=3127345 RepID=UPI003012BFE6